MAREDSDGSAVEKDVGFEIDKDSWGDFSLGEFMREIVSSG